MLLSVGISWLDLLDAAGLFPLSMPEDDIPLVEDPFTRIALDLSTVVFLVRDDHVQIKHLGIFDFLT